MRPIVRTRVLPALVGFVVMVVLGAALVSISSGGKHGFFESLYFVLVTMSTVGFSELEGMDSELGTRMVTAVLIIGGLATVAVFQAALTTVYVQGALGRAIRRNRMEKRVAALRDHIIVAGAGRTGQFVVQELMATKTPFVVLERDEPVMERLNEQYGNKLLYLLEDATEDATLLKAGVQHAAGAIAALTEDRDNLFVTLSVRHLNANARIISKAYHPENEPKLRKAGANSVVSPHQIGGFRLVGELLRPTVNEFFDEMMAGSESGLRFEEAHVTRSSEHIGQTLAELDIEQETNLFIVGIKHADGRFEYHPPPTTQLELDCVLIVLGEPAGVRKLRSLLRCEIGVPSKL